MQTEHPDRWVPIGLEHQFEAGSSHPVVVNGYGIAVWRGKEGGVQVWEDRCPHRGMRLSFGFVRDNRLTCLYHGWTYAKDGQCKVIPAHPDLEPPKTICVKTHRAASHRGIVFANLAETPEAPPPAEDDGWQPVRSLFVDQPLEKVRAFLADDNNPFGSPGKANGKAAPGNGSGAGLRDCLEVETDTFGDLVFALQPVDAEKTAIHVAGKGDTVDRPALAARLVRLRRAIEQN